MPSRSFEHPWTTNVQVEKVLLPKQQKVQFDDRLLVRFSRVSPGSRPQKQIRGKRKPGGYTQDASDVGERTEQTNWVVATRDLYKNSSDVVVKVHVSNVEVKGNQCRARYPSNLAVLAS